MKKLALALAFLLSFNIIACAETFNPDTSCTLSTNLIGYWNLDEANGVRVDSKGSSDLTDNNTVTQAVGKVSFAAQFVQANSEYLSTVDSATLSTGDIDFSVALWVFLDSKPVSDIIMSKWETTGNQREYSLQYNSVPDNFRFFVSSDGTGAGTTRVDALDFGSPSTGVFIFIVAWHDSVANTINIQINNGVVDSVSHSTGVFDSTAEVNIGALGGASFFDGRVDESGFWKKVLTTQERTDLHNSGNGNTYDSVSICVPVSVFPGQIIYPVFMN